MGNANPEPVLYKQDGTIEALKVSRRIKEYEIMNVLGCKDPVRLKTNTPGVGVITCSENYIKKGTRLNKRVYAEYGQVVFGDAIIIQIWRM